MPGDINDQVQTLMAAMPPYGDFALGNQNRDTIVSKIKGSTPGRATTPYLFVDGDKFIDIFFPKYAPAAFAGSVTGVLGQPDGFYSDWSISLLCQTMDHVTSSLRSQLRTGRIDDDVSGRNVTLTGFARAKWYGFIAANAPNSIQQAVAAIGPGNYEQALAIYVDDITAQDWIDFKVAEGPLWTHPDWELFHHYVKLVILGASQAQVDAAIATQKSRGLPVPASVDAGQWIYYAPWGNTIDYTSFQQDASPGILEEVCYTYPGSYWPSCMKESNSFEFTADGQPGNRYREAPSSCCFRAGAMVVMADGSLKAIEQVQVGDQVMTTSGAKPVVQVATPLLLDRTLYQFTGADFAFTGAQPFLTANSLTSRQPTFASFDPLQTMELVPLLSRFGITGLNQPWTPGLLAHGAGGPVSVPAPQVNAIAGGTPTETLYDLILDVQIDGLSEYFVGDTQRQYYVAAEVPRFDNVPAATAAFVAMLQSCRSAITGALAKYPAANFTDLLSAGLSGAAQKALPRVINQIQTSQQPATAAVFTVQTARTHASRAFELLTGSAGNGASTYDLRTGSLYSILARQLGIPFYLACALGWRRFPLTPAAQGTVLAMTINALELDGSQGLATGDTFELAIGLSRGGALLTRTLPSFVNEQNAGYYHSFEQVVYFDEWRLPAADDPEPWQVSFQLTDTTRGRLFVEAARTMLPDTVDVGYAFSQAPAYDASGRLVGRLTFDIRPLTPQSYVAERQAQAHWTPAAASAFAAALGEQCGQLLSTTFNDYLGVFGVTSTASSAGLIPKFQKPDQVGV